MFLEAVPDGVVVLPADYLRGRYSGCAELLSLFGVQREWLVFLKRSQVLVAPSVWLINVPSQSGMPHPLVIDMYRGLRRLLARPSEKDEVRLLFIRRAVETREIANWGEFSSLLTRLGARVVTTQGGLGQQIDAWQSASTVSGVLGSDLTNMLLGRAARLFVITPEWFGDVFFYGLAAALGVEWNELVCPEQALVELRDPKHRSSFRVDIADAERFYSLV